MGGPLVGPDRKGCQGLFVRFVDALSVWFVEYEIRVRGQDRCGTDADKPARIAGLSQEGLEALLRGTVARDSMTAVRTRGDGSSAVLSSV